MSLVFEFEQGLRLIGPSKQKVRFDQPDEKMLYFDLEVLSDIGVQTVEVVAKEIVKKRVRK